MIRGLDSFRVERSKTTLVRGRGKGPGPGLGGRLVTAPAKSIKCDQCDKSFPVNVDESVLVRHINTDHIAAQPSLCNDKIIERDTEENKLSLEQISELVRLSGV